MKLNLSADTKDKIRPFVKAAKNFKHFLRESLISKRRNKALFSRKEGKRFQGYYLSHVPDRYSLNYDKYAKGVNFFSYKGLEKWVHGNFENNVGDYTRYFFLNECFEYLLEENIVGNVAELGVYKGNSATLLATYARRVNTTCYLFDTFEGFDDRDIQGIDHKIKQDSFKDTSLEGVRNLVGEKNTVFVKGYFPESLQQVGELDGFSLLHIDCDLEKPMLDALHYFYPKMKKGGFIIMHDHDSLFWLGATNAINAFFKDKPEFIIPIPDKSGTCVVRKV